MSTHDVTIQDLQQKISQLEQEKNELLAHHQAQLEICCQEHTKLLFYLNKSQKDAQQKLAAIEAAIDGIALLKNELYLYLNEAHVDMFGYSGAAELIGKSWQILYSQEQIQQFQEQVFPVLTSCGHWHGETLARQKDGSYFDEELSLTLIDSEHLICVCRDITARKQAEASLKKSNQLLAIISKLQSEFIADANPNKIFLKIIDKTRQLTQSTCGFLGEVLYNSEGIPYVEKHYLKLSGNPSLEGLFHKNEVKKWLLKNLNNFLNSLNLSAANPMDNSENPPRDFTGDKPWNKFWLFPMYSENQLVGIMGIVNESLEDAQELKLYLQPLLTTCTNIINACRNQRGRRQAQQALKTQENFAKFFQMTLMP